MWQLLLLAAAPTAPVDFAREVAPIFERRCLECHGGKKVNAGLAVTSAARLLAGGVTGKAVVPGDPGGSYLLQRVRGEGGEDRMPPEGEPLAPEEIALLSRWIQEGARGADKRPEGPTASAQCRTADLASRVGPTPMQRLTRDEYLNTVRALFPWVAPRAPLPPDDKVGAFRSNTAAHLSDDQLRLYQQVADEIASQAVARLAQVHPACARPSDACALGLIDDVGRRVFRRPLTAEERQSYRGRLFPRMRARFGFAGAARAVLSSMLQAIPFLYRVELGRPDPALPAGIRRLTDHELATRLSYFIWDAAPDDELLDLAGRGALASPDALEAQARRLLRDERSKTMIRSFHEQLFRLDKVRDVGKSKKSFPDFDEDLRRAMLAESRAFIDHVVWAGAGNVETLLLGRFTFVDERLAKLYGLAAPEGPGLRRVELDPTGTRMGLLTQAAFLAGHASASETSVTQRGLTVRESLLCQELPPPPPGTDMNPKLPRLEKQPCAKCHLLMDPIGQGLESFDPIGRQRTASGNKPIEDAGKLLAVDDADPRFRGPGPLAERVARSPQFRACMVKQWLTYRLGREETDAERCERAALERAFDAAGGDVRELIVALTRLPAFALLRSE